MVELFGAERTLVRLIAGVLLLVLAEQFCVLEALAAHVTFERLVAFVEGVVVLRQVAHSVERFVALSTFESADCVASISSCCGHRQPFSHHGNGWRLGVTGVQFVAGQWRVLTR